MAYRRSRGSHGAGQQFGAFTLPIGVGVDLLGSLIGGDVDSGASTVRHTDGGYEILSRVPTKQLSGYDQMASRMSQAYGSMLLGGLDPAHYSPTYYRLHPEELVQQLAAAPGERSAALYDNPYTQKAVAQFDRLPQQSQDQLVLQSLLSGKK